jgi:carboxypeptidase PM20D1
MIRRVLLAALAAIVLLASVVGGNTLRKGSRQLEVPAAPALSVDEGAVARHLSAAVRLASIAAPDGSAADPAQFRALRELLQATYPLAHGALQRELVADRSLLYTWRGSDPSLPPILLMAHQDVVPVAPGTGPDWKQAPFSGAISEGFVWGRGAWDDKGNLVSQLEAVEMLLASGMKPRRTVYLAYGADEEVGGAHGAAAIAALLASRGVKLEFVLDEGLLIADGMIPGIDRPVALIGVAEKGYLSVDLSATAAPGHSSMPPAPGRGAIARLAAALADLDAHPMPAAVGGVAREMFETLAPEMHGMQRLALSNLWLFEPLVRSELGAAPATDAMLRTTTALTLAAAGNRDNVLPGRADATVNFRLLPGDDRAAVLRHVEALVRPHGVEPAAREGGFDPSPISPTGSYSYRLLERTLREVCPDALVAPGLMIGATDSHHFLPLSANVFRFSPVRARPEDLSRFHGSNERIATANLAELVRFYHRLIGQAAR